MERNRHFIDDISSLGEDVTIFTKDNAKKPVDGEEEGIAVIQELPEAEPVDENELDPLQMKKTEEDNKVICGYRLHDAFIGSLTPIEFAEVVAMFMRFDVNNDRLIDKFEARKILFIQDLDANLSKAEELMAIMNISGNRDVGFDEFCRFIVMIKNGDQTVVKFRRLLNQINSSTLGRLEQQAKLRNLELKFSICDDLRERKSTQPIRFMELQITGMWYKIVDGERQSRFEVKSFLQSGPTLYDAKVATAKAALSYFEQIMPGMKCQPGELPDEWMTWVDENLERGVDPVNIVSILAGKGFHPHRNIALMQRIVTWESFTKFLVKYPDLEFSAATMHVPFQVWAKDLASKGVDGEIILKVVQDRGFDLLRDQVHFAQQLRMNQLGSLVERDGKAPQLLDFWLACERGFDEEVMIFCTCLMPVNEEKLGRHTSEPQRPLSLAAMGNHVRVLEILIAHGADVRAVDRRGRTALHLAARSGHRDACAVLVDNKAMMFARDHQGNTPMHLAAIANHPTVVDYFAFKGREFVGIITSNKIRCKEGYTFQSLVHEVFETIQSAKLSSYELRRMEKRWLEEASHMFRDLMDPEIRYMLAPANTQVANDILKRFDPRPETGVYITRGALLQQEYVPNIASSHDLAVMLDYIFRQSSLDTQNRMKRTPLHCACDENVLASHEAVIKLLIDFHGCNVHMIDMHGWLAMELLMVDKRTSIVPSATRVREEYIRDVRERELDFITARNDAEDRLETIRRRREIMAECTYRSEHMSSTLWNIVREASLRVKTYDHGHWEIYEDPDTGNYFYCNPPSSEGSAEGEEDKYTNLTWNIPKELVLISNRAIALEYLIKMMSVFQRKLGRWEVYRSKATDLIFYYDSDLDVLRYSMPSEGKWVDLLRLSTPVERLGYGCEWEVRQDKTGNCFYRNVYNMECYWDQPADAVRIDPRERLCSAFQYRNRSTVQRWFSCEQCNRGWRIAGKPGRTILRICEGCINRCHKGHKGIRFVKESLVLCCCEQICKAVGCICLGRHLSERQQTVQREAFDGRNEIKRKAEHDRCMPPIFCPVPPVWPDGFVKKESGWRLCRRVPLNGQTLLNFGEVRANHEDTDDDEDDYHPEPQTDVLLLENGETSDGKEIESTVNQLMRMVDTEADVDIEAEDDTLPLASPLAKTDGKKRRGSLRKILLKELENEFEYTPPPGLPEGWIEVVDLEQPAVISVGSRVLAHCRYSPPRYYGYITAVHRRGKRGLIYSIKVDNIPVEEHLPRTHIEVISNPSFFCNIELGLSAWTIEQANTAPYPSSPLGMCGNEWMRVLDRAAFRRTFGPIDEMHHIFCNFLFYQEPEVLAREKAVLRIQRFLRKRRFLPLTSIPWMTSAFTMSVPAEVTRQKKELAAWAYLRRRSECIGEFFDLEKMEWEELIDKKGLELFYWLEATNTYSWDKPPYPDEGNQTNVDYFAVGQDVTYTIPGKGEELMTVVKVRFDDETGEDMYDIAQKFHGDGTVYRWLSRIQLKSIPLEGEEFYLKKSEMKWKETLKRHREAMERKQKRDQERLIAEELARYNETLVAERRMESGYNKDNIARRTRAKMMRLLQEVRDVEKENEQTVGAQRKKAVMAAIEDLKNSSTTRLSRADVLRLNRQLDLKLRMDEKIEQSKLVRKELLRKKKIAADRCKFTEDHLREKEAPVTTPRSLIRRRVIRNVHVAMRRQEDGWVICQWGCGDWVKKGFQQADHEKNLCPKRIIGCTQGCEEKHMEEVWLKLHNQEEEVVNELALLQQKANSAGINTKAALEGMTYQQFHEENECIKRLVDCPNRCLEFVPFDQLQRHLEELCTKRPAQPLECRLGCGQKFGGLVEELVKAEDDRLLHEQEQCENRMVRCNWKFEDGTLCASQMPAKERHLHRDYHITLMGTKTYLIPGTYLYKVPRGVPRLKVQVWGAGGGSGYFYNRVTGSGGGGAFVEAILNVQSYEVLEIVVGSGGGAGVTGTELEVADIENHRKLHASMDLRARTVSMLAGRPAPKPEDQNLNVDVIDSTCGVALGGTPGGGEGYGGGGCWATGGGGGYSIVSSRTARGSQALLVASGGGGGASNNGLPGGGMDGPLKGTLIDPRNGATATAEAGGAAGESGSMYNTKWPATNGEIWQGGNGSEFGAGGGGGYYGGGGGGTVPGVGGGGGGGSSYVYTPRVHDHVIVLGHGHMCGGLEHKPPQAAGIGDWDLTGGFVGQGGIGELTKTNRGNNGCVRIIKPGHY